MKLTQYNMATIGLAALMALTRMDHFGSAVTLPDASLAVFYLAGMLAGGIMSFIMLFAEAALIDYLAITQWQVSDYCISPAYVFLVPTYAVMFWTGRWSTRYLTVTSHDISRLLACFLGATSVAFLISNGSFYLFSGKFPELSLMQYAERVVRYFPAYISSTLTYSATILVCARFIVVLNDDKYNFRLRN